jgi:hypothetical protein
MDTHDDRLAAETMISLASGPSLLTCRVLEEPAEAAPAELAHQTTTGQAHQQTMSPGCASQVTVLGDVQ